jgi:hypothetical protein
VIDMPEAGLEEEGLIVGAEERQVVVHEGAEGVAAAERQDRSLEGVLVEPRLGGVGQPVLGHVLGMKTTVPPQVHGRPTDSVG